MLTKVQRHSLSRVSTLLFILVWVFLLAACDAPLRGAMILSSASNDDDAGLVDEVGSAGSEVNQDEGEPEHEAEEALEQPTDPDETESLDIDEDEDDEQNGEEETGDSDNVRTNDELVLTIHAPPSGCPLTEVAPLRNKINQVFFKGEDASHTNMIDVDLKFADLYRANLSLTNLTRVRLNNALLTNATLEKATLTNADLRNAPMVYADLNGAVLIGANLSGADLRGTDLTDADMSGAKLAGANLTGVVYKKEDGQLTIWPIRLMPPSPGESSNNRQCQPLTKLITERSDKSQLTAILRPEPIQIHGRIDRSEQFA
jgi:uncharacterized protein YjbI with pentapeptide repeats